AGRPAVRAPALPRPAGAAGGRRRPSPRPRSQSSRSAGPRCAGRRPARRSWGEEDYKSRATRPGAGRAPQIVVTALVEGACRDCAERRAHGGAWMPPESRSADRVDNRRTPTQARTIREDRPVMRSCKGLLTLVVLALVAAA